MIAIFIFVDNPVDNAVHMLITVEKHVNMWISYVEKEQSQEDKRKYFAAKSI